MKWVFLHKELKIILMGDLVGGESKGSNFQIEIRVFGSPNE